MQEAFLSPSELQHTLLGMQYAHAPQLHRLANAAELLRSTCPQAFVLTDAKGYIQAANQKYLDLVERSWEELKGKKPGVYSAGQTPGSMYAEMWGELSSGRTWRSCLLNRRPDGEEWWGLEELYPIKQAENIVVYWGVIQDLAAENPFPFTVSDFDEEKGFWRGNIDWVFQPIIDASTKSVLGYEALVRSKYGEKPVSPRFFSRWQNGSICSFRQTGFV